MAVLEMISNPNSRWDFFDGKMSYIHKDDQLCSKIKKEFEKYNLKIWDVCFYENPQKGRQIYLYLKKKRGSEISTRQAAALLSRILKKKMMPLPQQKCMVLRQKKNFT